MNIEIVEFYPITRDDKKQLLEGSMHVYLCDLDIDIRGIFVKKKRNFWFFSMPHKTGHDSDTGSKVNYPVFTFANLEKQKALSLAVRDAGKKYIEQKVLVMTYGNV